MESVHAGYSQPLRLLWQWLTLPFDSDSLCQSVLSAAQFLPSWLLIRAIGKHSDEMQSEVFAIQSVSLTLESDNEREAVLTDDAPSYWSLMGFRGTTATHQQTAMRKDREKEDDRVKRETILYEYVQLLT